jgi:hypothetical protein
MHIYLSILVGVFQQNRPILDFRYLINHYFSTSALEFSIIDLLYFLRTKCHCLCL